MMVQVTHISGVLILLLILFSVATIIQILETGQHQQEIIHRGIYITVHMLVMYIICVCLQINIAL